MFRFSQNYDREYKFGHTPGNRHNIRRQVEIPYCRKANCDQHGPEHNIMLDPVNRPFHLEMALSCGKHFSRDGFLYPCTAENAVAVIQDGRLPR